jgi:sporulation protein YabP
MIMNRSETPDSVGRVLLENRSELALTGIENIVSFDETFVTLETVDSLLSVDGEGMRVLKMDVEGGEVSIVGKINALVYSDKKSSRRSGGLFRGGKKA